MDIYGGARRGHSLAIHQLSKTKIEFKANYVFSLL